MTYGVRYGVYKPPYELNGVQVVPQTPLSQFFADRVGGQALGIPAYALSQRAITYDLGGPVNNGPGYYALDKNNFAPRLAIAWSPSFDGLAGTLARQGQRNSRRRRNDL